MGVRWQEGWEAGSRQKEQGASITSGNYMRLVGAGEGAGLDLGRDLKEVESFEQQHAGAGSKPERPL